MGRFLGNEMAHRKDNGRKPNKGTSLPALLSAPPRRDRAGPSGQGYPGIRAMLATLGLPLISALLLSAAFPPLEISWMAYLAPVPLILAAARARTGRRIFLSAWLAGAIFFAINMYWVSPISLIGGVALYLFMGLYWAVFGWALRGIALTTRLPLALLSPVLWVALEFFRGWFLTGLPWLYIGHTQYENLVLIQTADLFGAHAQSFLIMMTAGLVADLLTRPIFVSPIAARASARVQTMPGQSPPPPAPVTRRRFSTLLAVAILLAAGAWAGTVAYGRWRLDQSALTERPGPVVASVQTCISQDVKQAVRQMRIKDIERSEEEMLGAQCNLSLKAAGRMKVDLIVWPETMVPGILNESFLTQDITKCIRDPDMFEVYNYLQHRSQGYWKTIQNTAGQAGAPVLFGGTSVTLEGAYRLANGGFMPLGPRRNTAYLVGPETRDFSADGTYSKNHLVPFGEFMPFKNSCPPIYNLLQKFSPYPFDYSLTPGETDQTPMTVKFDKREARFLVPICYEDAMAYRCREMVRPRTPGGPKNADFLVNISNDGWFGGSTELDQHLNLCVFRAVENRVPIVRSVNTGISAIISPTGQIETTVHDAAGNRRWLEGEIAGRLTLDDRVAPYTVIGDILALGCEWMSIGLGAASIILAVLARRRTA
jgi:apolipoprotein N-acyltransferase